MWDRQVIDASRISGIRHVVLDLDGTVYTGDRLHQGVDELLEVLRDRAISFSFLTNNSSRSVADYVEKLRGFGLEVGAADICTPVAATVAALRSRYSGVARLFVLGTPSLHEEFEASGFEVISDDSQAPPDAVVVGFDRTLTYDRLCRCAYWIALGLPYLATHPDKICPTDAPTVLVDCGAICAALAAATGRVPDAVLGKPDPAMLASLADQRGLALAAIAMVGDRLMTDMVMAKRAGALAVLVLTGEATAADVAELAAGSAERPQMVVPDLAALAAALAARG